jgi:branched-chain amino acid transport system substrate-binding protein
MLKRCFLLIITLLTFLNSQASADQAIEPFKIGVILPLSGEAASVGQAIKNGLTLGYEKLPDDLQKKISLFYEDDGLNPTNTISAFHKLLNTKNIQAVINASSGTGKALAPIVEKYSVPLLAIATDPEIVKGKKYVVNFWVTPEQLVKVAVPALIKRHYQKIARIASMHDAPLSTIDLFDKLHGKDLEVLLDEKYPMNIKDFRSFLLRVKAKPELDAITVLLMPGQLGVFAKQAKQAGINLPLFGFESFEDSNEVSVSDGALVGQLYVNNDDPNQKFINEFKAKYPDSSLWGAANGHDAILLFAEALKTQTDSAGVNKFLHQVRDFSGALGTYSASGDNRFTLPAALKIVTRDGFKKVNDN